ncbi:SWIRM domain-containing protein [Paracoccidioides lutzii Pb01]|uniref:SWIRM domain-containing protein n=1 Tax=Paracoccidioides lutzii (strain ATCC MYA-826 / Pb01) TaxID=502779 RepID=C1HCE5_PARBA|nr:SWIRM domain-containing protein [Paracoccidioides lutzii Pb01]EEH38709.1 SWIRM domain-containing protein [Paracoccidioides lutzii Pb01]
MNRLPPVSSLMSPPEMKSLDSFNQSLSPCHSQLPSFDENNTLPPISADRKRTQSEMDLPSPPVTPYVGNKKKSDIHDHIERDVIAVSTKDPVLFPQNDTDILPDEPLFGPQLALVAEGLVDKHMATQMIRFQDKKNKPTRKEYIFALSCVPIVGKQYNQNPGAWAMKEREFLDRQLSVTKRVGHETVMKLKTIAPAPAKRTSNGSGARAPRPRPRRTPKSTPRQRVYDSFDIATPAPKPARVIGTNRDDTDYRSLPDYCPSIETLRGNTKGLKADWKGQMLDLTNDPDRHELDPAEVGLAATLRLSCATYLCSKRRIFEARLNALRIGKEFRKTDAQQACKIDVNKASKLWTAYEKVGWFNREYFRQYL